MIIVAKRALASGGGSDSSATTDYFATCDTDDGSRDEYQVWDGKTYGKIAVDDAGVPFVRSK
ncbi:MAG: hypothetical protein H6822_20620 [Planctomycetaceae bacterium]|nr:hypothetical protein [Planctomycetales bacterium]MCB9924595.1 hypothetical protein [Planctomycetaceae bacterium]